MEKPAIDLSSRANSSLRNSQIIHDTSTESPGETRPKTPEHSSATKSKFRAIMKKAVKTVEAEDDDSKYSASEETPPNKKKVSMKEGVELAPVVYLRDKSMRQKLLEEENARLGKGKALDFHSIKAGLGRREYEEFLQKSPLKPLILKMLPENNPNAAAAPPQEKRRSLLVRMKTESSFHSNRDIVLPALSARGDNTNSISLEGSLTSLASQESNSNIPKLKKSMSKSFINPLTMNNNNNNDDYSRDGFESSTESLAILNQQQRHIIEEEKLAKQADDARNPVIAPFLLHELQSDYLIDNRFGWKRKKDRSTGGAGGGDMTSISKSTSDQEIPFRLNSRGVAVGGGDGKGAIPPRLGDSTPTGSFRQSIRAAAGSSLLSSSLKSMATLGPGKLTRKATVANLMANKANVGPGGQHGELLMNPTDPENSENTVMEHYSGLLYHDPQVNTTWKECNLPKKVKSSLFQSHKSTLSAGRNMNAYRPWGPARPIDPLDAILEKTIEKGLAHGEDHDEEGGEDSEDEEYDQRGRPRSGRTHKSGGHHHHHNNNHSGSRGSAHGRSKNAGNRKRTNSGHFSKGSSSKKSQNSGSTSAIATTTTDGRHSVAGEHYKDRHRSLQPLSPKGAHDAESRKNLVRPRSRSPDEKKRTAENFERATSSPKSSANNSRATSGHRPFRNNNNNNNDNNASPSRSPEKGISIDTNNSPDPMSKTVVIDHFPMEMSQVTAENSLETATNNNNNNISSFIEGSSSTPMVFDGDFSSSQVKSEERKEYLSPEERSPEDHQFSPAGSRSISPGRKKRSPLLIHYVKGPMAM
jgi:hypothetical protein